MTDQTLFPVDALPSEKAPEPTLARRSTGSGKKGARPTAARDAAPPLPEYATAIPRVPFRTSDALVVWLERAGSNVKAGMIDPQAETYRLKAHFWAGGYEIGLDEWVEIQARGVLYIEADYRGVSVRKIYVVTYADALAKGREENTPNGPRWIVPYDVWTAEAAPVEARGKGKK